MDTYTATIDDLDAVATAEAECFPVEEAASREELAERIGAYGNHFWLMFDGGTLVSYVDGLTTNERNLTDEMFADTSLHDEAGAWQMIFGVGTVPAYRGRGLAGRLIERAVADSREQGRAGLVLTCKERLLGFYRRFGFVSEGLSGSEHGGAEWYQMRLTF
jgi:predicted GNAT family N-acyltransferase